MKNRFYDKLPQRFKTDDNRRMSSVAEDVMFAPEDFGPVEGQIGDVAGVSADELAREPLVAELTPERARYQLSVAAVSGGASRIDREAFYTDLLNQVEANGGLVDDHSRLFETDWFAWTPPIDYDRWTNFSKYRWLGQGTAALQGEYVTKDPGGCRTVFHRVDGPAAFTKVTAALSLVALGSFPAGTAAGELREDGTDADRKVYKWTGSAWQVLEWSLVDSLPLTTAAPIGTHLYVARFGYDFNRITVYEYASAAGRWIPRQPIISAQQPTATPVGTMWEDCGSPPARRIRKLTVAGWVAVAPASVGSTMVGAGVPADGTVRFVPVDVSAVPDGWQKENWWRHVDDLSPVDRAALPAGTTATRPILQLWPEIEAQAGSARTARHVLPLFKVYGYSRSGDDVVAVGAAGLTNATFPGSAIVRYKQGFGADDPVLGFPCSFDNNAEFQFEVSIETDAILANGEDMEGYRFYKDVSTGLCRSMWTKAPAPIAQVQHGDGTWEMPFGLTNNADHGIATVFSRTDSLRHFASVIGAGSAAGEEPTGANGFRWSRQDPTASALSIDPEASLLRPLALLFDKKLDFPDAVRAVGQETSRFYRRFLRVLEELWNTGDYSAPDDTLTVAASALVDEVLTRVLVAKQPEGPYWLSDMGSYLDSTTGETKPIVVPPSTARTGATPVYSPRIATLEGADWILCHDGRIISAYGDGRDLVVLDLEGRFFAKVPAIRRTETTTFSAIAGKATWETRRFVGGRAWTPSAGSFSDLVADAFSEPTPGAVGYSVYSVAQAGYAVWGGTTWAVFPASIGDTFLTTDDGKLYSFNGFTHVEVKKFPRPHAFDYTLDEAAKIVRREFERWSIANSKDSADRADYSSADPFTWNYSSAGVEGNWRGIYKRIYGTIRPHSAPWEIAGFSIEPAWWRTTFVPTSTNADGSPRYGSAHAMWAALKSGGSLASTLEPWQRIAPDAPTPVNGAGELIDPVACGAVASGAVPDIRKSDRWRYGDGSPVEHEFWRSPEARAAEAILAYLIKPAKFLEALWSDYVIPIGAAAQKLLGGVQVVNVETLRRSPIADVLVHGDVGDDGVQKSNPGVNAWVSDRIVSLGGSPGAEFGTHVATARTVLAWKTGGFVVDGSVSVQTSGGVRVPDDDLDVAVHHAEAKATQFHSGIIVSREPDTTYRVFGYDSADPKFRVIRGAKPLVAGQIELRDTFTTLSGQATFTTSAFTFSDNDLSRLSVLVDGMRVDDKFVVKETPNKVTLLLPPAAGTSVAVTLITNQSTSITRVRQFVENGRNFYYYPASQSVEAEVQYGDPMESPQAVVEFIYDHGRWMESKGWTYGGDDSEETKNDWLAVARRFAAWASEPGRRAGDIFADVAGGAKLDLDMAFGQAADLEAVSNGSYPIVDIGGLPIPPAETSVSRIGGTLTVRSPDREIFGLRVFERVSEHVVFISPKTRFGDVVYDPVLGVRHRRLVVRAMRSNGWVGRMDAPGFLISGDSLVPSLEKQAKDFIRAYDQVRPVNDKARLEQAWNLYGWSDPKHLVDVGASLPSRLAFHKGHLTHKGTGAGFKAFVRGTRSGAGSATISEAWAWLLADFGALEHRNRVRFYVREQDVKSAVQTVAFVGALTGTDGAIEVLPFDRLAPDPATRWIVPPKKGANFEFPMSADKKPLSDKFSYRMRIVGDSPDGGVQDTAFHWDPSIGLHEPASLSQISYYSPSDPARYTDGLAGSDSPGHEWGASQVGRLWLDSSQLSYADYRNLATADLVAADWGKLSHKKVVSQTVTAVGYELTTSMPHEMVAGQRAFAKLKDGRQLFAYVFSAADADTVTVTLSSGDDAEDIGLNATFSGAVVSELYASDVKLYEWVESLVPPTHYDETEAVPFQADDPSWCTTFDSRLQATKFYFWVRGSVIPSGGRSDPAVVIEDKLRNPTSYGLSWFAPTSKTTFIFSGKNYRVDERSAIELAVDGNDVDFHQEWTLIKEGETVDRTPAEIIAAVMDSLIGFDSLGGAVPSPSFTEQERHGVGRQKTVFRDRDAGRAAMVDSVNRSLSRMRAIDLAEFSQAFPTADIDTWWSRVDWRRIDMEGIEVTQVSKDLADRDLIKMPREGDTVRVVTAVPDPAGGDTWALYALESGEWAEFGAGNATAEVNAEMFTGDAAAVRARVLKILSVVDAEVENEIVFGVLYEMLSQHESCNWLFKTSLVDIENTVSVSQPAFKPRDELPLLLQALDASKPFHTKVRDVSTTVTTDVDESKQTVTDTSVAKTSVVVDRLACNFFDESGWNADGWSASPWDRQPWKLADHGAGTWNEVARFSMVAGVKSYTANGLAYGFASRVTTYDGADVVVTPSVAVTVWPSGLATFDFAGVPPPGRLFVVEQASAESFGPAPQSPDPDFEPLASSLEHAAARVAPYVSGHGNDRALQNSTAVQSLGCSDLGDPLGGSPGERARIEWLEQVSVTVTTYATPAWMGWNAQPWNVQPWDGYNAMTAPSEFTALVGSDTRLVGTNLLKESQTFDSATWTKGGAAVVANLALAPDGTMTADRLRDDAAVSQHQASQPFTLPAAATYTWSVHIKADGQRYVSMYPQGTGVDARAVFDLQTGLVTFTTGAQYLSSAMTAMPNGWFRCSITYTGTLNSIAHAIYLTNVSNVAAPSYLGTSIGVYLWGSQLEQDVAPSVYTVTAATVPQYAYSRFAAAGFTETFVTSEVRTMAALDESRRAITAPSFRYKIKSIESDRGGGYTALVAGVDYTLTAPHSAKFLPVPDFLLPGSGTVFVSAYPIASLRVGSTPLALGTEYTLSPDKLTATLTVANTSGQPLVASARLPTAAGSAMRITYSSFKLLSPKARASARLQNRLLRSNNFSLTWVLTSATVAQNATGPKALGSAANSAWTLTDASASVTGKVVQTLAGVATPSCVKALSFYVKKTLVDAHKMSAWVKYTGAVTPQESRIVLDTNTGAVTSSTAERAKVHDAGDYWRVHMVARNSAEINLDVEVGMSPAYNTDGTAAALVSAQGTKVATSVWLVDSPQDDVAYAETTAAAVDTSWTVGLTMAGAEAVVDSGSALGATVGVVYHTPVETNL